MMAIDKQELRVNISRELMQRVDAIAQMNGWDRTQATVWMLTEITNKVHHKASLLCRMSGGNPMPLECEKPTTDWATL